MILLDTNVVSAVMTPLPPETVVDWLDRQETSQLFLSAITLAEIGYGLAVLPDSRRRRHLDDSFERFVAQGFAQRMLTFDEPAARMYGELMGHRMRLGRPLAVLDGQIAAIARVHLAALATRNTRDFEECGLELVNPFEA